MVWPISEALLVRRSLHDYESECYVFSDLGLESSDFLESYVHHKIIPVINSLRELKTILESSLARFLPLAIMLNLGMNRMGIEPVGREFNELTDLLKKHKRP